jgi:glucokinase
VSGSRVTIGVDLGGTGSRIVALGAAGNLDGERTVLTGGMGSPGDPGLAVRDLAGHIRAVAGPRPVSATGIGASGPVDASGVIRNDETLPGFSHVDVCSALAALVGAPCVIDNDAVTAAIGEHARGAGRGAARLLMITLGTGVGTCVLDRGRPYRGSDGIHPESGHLPVPGPSAPCYCGLPACWEQKASRAALERACQAFLGPGAPGSTARESAEFTAERARAGDRDAQEVFRSYGADVGQGVATLTTAFRPSHVVIGGGGAAYFDLFAAGTRGALARQSPYEITAELRPAELGDLAGAIGAAVMARAAQR